MRILGLCKASNMLPIGAYRNLLNNIICDECRNVPLLSVVYL